jgi:hypothetical protein
MERDGSLRYGIRERHAQEDFLRDSLVDLGRDVRGESLTGFETW